MDDREQFETVPRGPDRRPRTAVHAVHELPFTPSTNCRSRTVLSRLSVSRDTLVRIADARRVGRD